MSATAVTMLTEARHQSSPLFFPFSFFRPPLSLSPLHLPSLQDSPPSVQHPPPFISSLNSTIFLHFLHSFHSFFLALPLLSPFYPRSPNLATPNPKPHFSLFTNPATSRCFPPFYCRISSSHTSSFAFHRYFPPSLTTFLSSIFHIH